MCFELQGFLSIRVILAYSKSSITIITVLFLVILSAQAIRDGLDVVVGTPGRILDHMVNGTLDLTQLK